MARIIAILPILGLAMILCACGGGLQNPETNSQNQINPNQNDLQQIYSQALNSYTTNQGAGGYLRINRPENNNDTISEGQAYGMLISASLHDKKTFEMLWQYSQAHFNQHGLMAWHIDSSGEILDQTSATDADEDMAYALIIADNTWGGYKNQAVQLIQNIRNYEIEPGTLVVKPGDNWGGSSALSVSYFAPAYYKVFAAYTQDNTWLSISDKSYSILALATESNTGLIPDWCDANGQPVQQNIESNQDNFSYNASRVCIRMAMDALWNHDPRALSELAKLNAFFSGIGASNLKSGYSLNGQATVNYLDEAFIACYASSALTEPDGSQFKQNITNMDSTTQAKNYFDTFLQLLSLELAQNQLKGQ